jgi:hypothetical protein
MERGLRGVCRAEGMGVAVVELPARCPGWAAAGAGLAGGVLQGTEAGVEELQGGVCLRGGGAGMRLGLLTTFVTLRPGWLM